MPKLYILDGHNLIYRSYFAGMAKGQPRMSTAKGFPTGAVYRFIRMLLKIVREEQPDYLAIAFDPEGPTVRSQVYEEYKAHRQPMPDDLSRQIPYIHKVVEAMNIPVLVVEGQEADDVIGTLALQAKKKGIDVTIISADKDMMQMVSKGLKVYDTLYDKEYSPGSVLEKWGVEPEQIPDLLGLMGDASDNIPGVMGVGEKTAQELLSRYGSVENLLQHLDEISKPKLREALERDKDRARLSKELATIKTDVPLQLDWESLRRQEPREPELMELYRELEFKSLLREKAAAAEKEAGAIAADGGIKTLHELPPAAAGSPVPPAKLPAVGQYQTILTERDFQQVLSALERAPEFAIDTETTSLDAMRAELVGISLCWQEGEGCYIPLSHRYLGVPRQLPLQQVLSKLAPYLTDAAKKKCGQNLKYDWTVLARAGVKLQGMAFDTMVASYLLNPDKYVHKLDNIAKDYLDYQMMSYEDVCGSGKKQIGFDEVSVERATCYSAEDADIAFRLTRFLRPQIQAEGLEDLFLQVEMPLVEVLAHMEYEGFLVDAQVLQKVSKEMGEKLAALEEEIHQSAGRAFNINSPKQLAEVLFKKLQLEPRRITKTGQASTDTDVLEELALVHPLPGKILEYRSLAKLKSTYADALPTLINPGTGRIHTSLNQTIAATGRLSSSEPNLQNIPIRTEEGKKIRQAFTAPAGSVLLSADYSQIELRLLAHYSGDPNLVKAFKEGVDIHAQTASQIFGLPADKVSVDLRRLAKTVNFGIIYGLSPFGLAAQLKIPQSEAKRYIDSYYKYYQGVWEYKEKFFEEARAKGYVTTLLGRRRFIPKINARHRTERQEGEREAFNTPLQGSAADLIKLAMVNLARDIKQKGLESKLILQVHDELVFEVPEKEVNEMKAMVKKEMEGVGAYCDTPLRVPLVVDVGTGKNWNEAH
jgi:DNA polymerase-1